MVCAHVHAKLLLIKNNSMCICFNSCLAALARVQMPLGVWDLIYYNQEISKQLILLHVYGSAHEILVMCGSREPFKMHKIIFFPEK